MRDQVSGIVKDILYRVGDFNAQYFTSGQVEYLMFNHLNDLNGQMDVQFSGNYSTFEIDPPITGTILLPILELMVAKNLVGTALFNASNTFTLTSFREGDSTVNVADRTKALAALYKLLSDELVYTIAQVKFTVASSSPSTVIGIDGGVTEQISFRNYDVYRANQT